MTHNTPQPDAWLGGLYLVQGATRAAWMHQRLLPRRFWSLSDCICAFYPNSWGLWWVNTDPQTLQQHRETMGLTQEAFDTMRHEVNELMEDEHFGWPNVFLDLPTARAFYARYLQQVPHLKLLSIALPPKDAAILIAENTPSGPTDGPAGVYLMLKQHLPQPPDGTLRGYEILGFDHASFHSFVCNGLEHEYTQKLGLSLNQHGLLSNAHDAAIAAAYTMRDDVGAEPVLWQAWRVAEHPLTQD